jgi:PAS domain S-box-containing protein
MVKQEYITDWVLRAQKIAHLGIWDQDAISDKLWWSDETFRILGLDPHIITPSFDEFLQVVHPDDRALIVKQTALALNSDDNPYKVDYRIIWPDKSERIVHEEALIERDDKGTPIKVTGIIQDITSSKQAEEALRESEERFRTVADFTHDWEYWIAPDSQHIYVSPSCERITGYSSEAFLNDHEMLEKIVHPDDQSTFVSHMCQVEKQEGRFSLDFRIITRRGEERWISHVCQPVYGPNGRYLGQRASNRDISKQKLMQKELLKSKKLESLGVLAGGIAHDFNNLMSAVVSNISLAKIEMKPGSKAFANLLKAEKASIQTKELTARLITFSKGGEPVKETVSMGNLAKDSVASSLKGPDIDVRFSIPDDISPTKVDKDQMKQAICNIVTNAQEAMGEQGTINVSCANVNIGEKDALILKDGKYVKISIEDQGPGIPEEDLAKIFDPYFSTKDMGTQKGMGLGLSVSDSIVKKHDGIITVESELGPGTTFSIYLPASVKEIVETAPVKKPVPEISLSQGGKILVMDDEEVIRDVSNALLTHLGYNAEVAVEGVEAIEMYEKAMKSEKPFEAVILDLTNEIGLGGAETIERLLEIDPDVRAIVTTGYSSDPIINKFRDHGFRFALPKPFTLGQLKTALQDAIAKK